MSKAVRDSLRRARVRELTRGAERRGVPELQAGESVRPAKPPRPIHMHSFKLEPAELEALSKLADKHDFARTLLEGLEDEQISEHAAWNAREALEDELGHGWASRKAKIEGTLGRKITQLFNEVD